MIKLAKKNNPSASFKVMDAKNLKNIKTNFNGVICGFTFPYLNKTEVSKLITTVAKLLPENGIFYISTMEDAYKNSKLISGSNDKSLSIFTYYYKAEFLIEILQKNNFTIEKLFRKEYPEKKDTSNDLIIIAKKF